MTEPEFKLLDFSSSALPFKCLVPNTNQVGLPSAWLDTPDSSLWLVTYQGVMFTSQEVIKLSSHGHSPESGLSRFLCCRRVLRCRREVLLQCHQKQCSVVMESASTSRQDIQLCQFLCSHHNPTLQIAVFGWQLDFFFFFFLQNFYFALYFYGTANTGPIKWALRQMTV